MKKQIRSRLLRILCTALSLCMIIALIPSAFAAAPEVSINFLTDVSVTVDTENVKYFSTDPNAAGWAYHSGCINGESILTKNKNKNSVQNYGNYVAVKTRVVDDYYAIKFTARTTGEYKIKYNYFTFNNGGYGNVYVVPLTPSTDVATVIGGDEGRFFTDVCYYSDVTEAAEATPIISQDKVSLTANTEYLVVFAVSKVDPKFRMFPLSLEFATEFTVNDPDLSAAFSDVVKAENSVVVPEKASINILTYTTDGTEQAYEDTIEATFNEATQITAPEAPTGYKFLYWAMGLTNSKQIIPGETCSIYPTVANTNLIAVYEPISGTTGDKVEFYNYNGQLLDAAITAGKMPELPSMTGYGKADRWALYGSTDTFNSGDDASAFATGTHIFVAQYNDLEENITVTAENCTVNGGNSAVVKYGDTVTCVANGEGIFKWWEKIANGKTEIVSLNEGYTFKAWEDCTVKAVYGDKAPTYVGDTMRIIIDILDVAGISDKAVMAEFVGLDSAVEKGIMLGTKKIAMSSNDNQFTVINDEEAADIKGYAILDDGTLITDN